MDIPQAFRNVVQQLQMDPARYKLFGIYWWPVKRLLKDSGYDQHQLPMLGDYQDPDTAALVPAMPLEETLRAAFEEYRRNARFPHPDGMVEDPDGELVVIFDQDAGL
jgi:hypothetical protein